MSTEIDFQIDWLNERFTFDSKARNQVVEKACHDFFTSKEELNIIDIGSGTGSNFIYFLDRFDQNQNWTFVELNPELIQASIERVKTIAQQRGYEVSKNKQCLELQSEQKLVTIDVVQHSFLELEDLPKLPQVDLLTAGAVFDLLNYSMLEDLLQLLVKNKIALLSTINYEGMAFQPEHPSDVKFVQLYEAHMIRPQHFGQSLGPKTIDALLDICKKTGVQTQAGDSHWQIEGQDQKMHQFLLNYMEEGVGAMLSDDEDQKEFAQWMKAKRILLAKNQLSQIVFHRDIFAHPDF